MSIIQTHTAASLSENWRTINIDALDPESSENFDLSTLHPSLSPSTPAEVKQLATQARQLLRAGDTEGALRGVCEAYTGGDSEASDLHLQTVMEVLQSIKASEMTPLLKKVFATEGGAECLDTLMKFLYKGMAGSGGLAGFHGGAGSHSSVHMNPLMRRSVSSSLTPQGTGRSSLSGVSGGGGEPSGAAMSVLLSWHEKIVEVAGLGTVGRVMTDRRVV